MKVIIDPYRGGVDTGVLIGNKYEKNLLLEMSKYLSSKLNSLGIENELVRYNDVSLTNRERIELINNIKDKDDIVIENRFKDSDKIEIVYSIRNNDSLAFKISNKIKDSEYIQKRLPINVTMDYDMILRNMDSNESLIIYYNDLINYKEIVDNIACSLREYIIK